MQADLLTKLCAIVRGEHTANRDVTPATPVPEQPSNREKARESQELPRLQVKEVKGGQGVASPVTRHVTARPEPIEAAIQERGGLAADRNGSASLNAPARAQFQRCVGAVAGLEAACPTGLKIVVEDHELAHGALALLAQSVRNDLRPHKAEVFDVFHNQRRAIVAWINDHFKGSPLGECAYCGGVARTSDPFIALFVDQNRAEIHASCHPAWLAQQETNARAALGIDDHD
jgi:hypothetical protein